jgi:hypothetical protein
MQGGKLIIEADTVAAAGMYDLFGEKLLQKP